MGESRTIGGIECKRPSQFTRSQKCGRVAGMDMGGSRFGLVNTYGRQGILDNDNMGNGRFVN